MGTVKAIRCDFRMIHGQIGSAWIRNLNANKVVLVSEKAAHDDFLKKTMVMAAPPSCKQVVYTVDEAIEQWNKDRFGPGTIMIIFQYIQEAYEMYNKGFKFPYLNIANTTNGDDMKHVVRTCNVTKEQQEMLLDLLSKGVKLYAQGLPEESQADIGGPLQKITWE
ncbi:MAG: PTS sugar transporter subunit IIB [Erysipelotrichaceae bacterium]|nr:PTS sugar transporter subunit IIB [Erysipelotrichaceae bacterium]